MRSLGHLKDTTHSTTVILIFITCNIEEDWILRFGDWGIVGLTSTITIPIFLTCFVAQTGETSPITTNFGFSRSMDAWLTPASYKRCLYLELLLFNYEQNWCECDFFIWTIKLQDHVIWLSKSLFGITAIIFFCFALEVFNMWMNIFCFKNAII